MSNFYLVPVDPTQIGDDTVSAPKYMLTDLAGLNITCIPYGVEAITLLSLPAPNAALAAEADVYAFPDDLSEALTDSDVTTLSAYLDNANVPSTFLTVGMTFQDVVRQIAQVFLLAQAISSESDGASIFPSGTTVDSPIASQTMGKGGGNSGGIGGSTPSALANVAGSTAGVFDLSDVDTSESIGDTLLVVSQQFTEPIQLGGEI